jgi:multidrug transporter EmrE-like cation transporter
MILYKILLGVGIFFNVIAQLLLKHAMTGYDLLKGQKGIFLRLLDIFSIPFLWVSLFCYGIGFLLYSISLSKLELSKAYPLASVGAIIIISTISIFLFKEDISVIKIVGLILCIIGIIFIFK